MDELIANSDTKEVGLLVKEMRDSIDELSNIVGARLRTGKMQAKIDKNLGTYINRSYRAYDDPSWKGLETLKKNLGKKEADKILSDAETYLREQVGIGNDDMEAVVRYIARGMKPTEGVELVTKKGWKGEDPEKFVRKMAEFARGSAKPFSKRKYQAPQLRALWGEYKDPYKNFARTYEKLSIARAEGDFIQDVHKHLIDQNLAIEGEEIGKGTEGIQDHGGRAQGIAEPGQGPDCGTRQGFVRLSHKISGLSCADRQRRSRWNGLCLPQDSPASVP